MQYRNIDKQALKENGYTVLSKITIVGTDTVFTEDDHIVDWTYEDYRYVPNNGFIGQFVERILDGNLQDISEDVVLEDTEINLQLGIVNALDNNTTTWYDYGNFLITKVEKTDTTGNYKFESADYTKKFNKVFDGDYTDTTYIKSFNQKIEDEETVTALWLAQYVCAQAGVLLNDTNFTNYDFVISSNQYDSGDTLRKVMQDIGKLAYSWVRVGEDNKVHIDFTPKATSSVDQYDQLTTDEYYVSKKSDLAFGPVNKVLIGMSDVEGENMYETSPDYTEETECAIKIYDNNLTNTEELRALALDGCDRLFGLTYTPIEINSVGHPWLDGDELIKLTNVDGEIIYTYPFNRKITYAGYIEGTIGAEAQTAQESKYEYKSDIISDVKKTSFIVDKQEQTITGLIENMNDIILETTIKKTEEGNPIEIYDAGSYPVEDFKIYGNAVQDGTPSVQNPVEIETLTSKEENGNYSGTNIEFYNDTDNYSIENNYVLEGQTTQNTTTGKNLYEGSQDFSGTWGNSSSWETDSQTYNGLVVKKRANAWNGLYKEINITSGKTYYFSFYAKSDTSRSIGVYLTGGTGNMTPQNASYDTTTSWKRYSIRFTATTTGTIRARVENKTAINNSYLYICGYQLEESNSLTSYEPYTGGIPAPNPSFPEPINVVTGLQEIEACGKNLLPQDKYIATTTKNGVTYTNNGDGTFNLIGTATANTTIQILPPGEIELEANQPYYLYSSIPYNATTFNMSIPMTDNGATRYLLANSTYTPTSKPTLVRLQFYVASGNSVNATNVRMMLVKGNTAPTEYEPYKGNTYEINLGKNLFDIDNSYHGTINASGGVGTNEQYRTTYYLPCSPNETYYFSTTQKSGQTSKQIYIAYYDSNKTFISRLSYNLLESSFTSPSNAYYMRAGVYTEGQENVMLEKGSSKTSYSPYFTPIELCEINDYKDLIFKGKGVNLFGFNESAIDKTSTYRSSALQRLNTTATDNPNEIKFNYGGGNYCRAYFELDGLDGTLSYKITFNIKSNTTSYTPFATIDTTNSTSEKLVFYISGNNGSTSVADTQYFILNNIQVEYGTTASLYEPYNSKDKWLLHKEIGKLILGNANYIYNSSNKRFYNTFSDINLFTPTDTSRHVEYIKAYCFNNSTTDADGTIFQYQNQLIMHNYNYTDTTDFKNWLSNINAYLYYVLQNPTTEEITNEEVINQLNSIELLDGLNNIFITSSNLPGILNINQTKYPYQIIRIKDNIGIYNDYKLILKDVEYARVTDNYDYIYPENDKWYSYKIINKINSYNGETIDTDYISTTGELSTGATVYYVADEPNIQEIVDENILTPLNDLKNTLLYNGYNKIELLNELVDKLSITYLTDSELNASYATKSELQITANNITSTVSETTTKVNELDEKIEEVNASISEQTSTSITDWFNTSLKSLIEDLETSTNNNSNEIINIQSYIRRGRITDVTSPYYNQAYIELGDSTNQTTLRILQNRIQFLTNGEETAYISNNQLYINESTILTKEKIGHWVTTEDEDGLLNTYWEE